MTPLQRYLDPELLRRLSTLQISARTVAAGITTGLHPAPTRGSSIEFRQHRFYTPGDEPRRIDWRIYARTDKPFVRDYEQETNLRCLLLLDASGSMAYPQPNDRTSKILTAKKAAAALAYLMLSQTESVGLATFGGTTQYLAPHPGKSQLSRILTALDKTVPAGNSDPGQALSAAANRLARRSLIILLTDAFTEPPALAKGLARLHHDRHETAILRILHPHELTFPFQQSTPFTDLEGGGGVKLIEPATTKSAYLARLTHHTRQLQKLTRLTRTRLLQSQSTDDLLTTLSRLVA